MVLILCQQTPNNYFMFLFPLFKFDTSFSVMWCYLFPSSLSWLFRTRMHEIKYEEAKLHSLLTSDSHSPGMRTFSVSKMPHLLFSSLSLSRWPFWRLKDLETARIMQSSFWKVMYLWWEIGMRMTSNISANKIELNKIWISCIWVLEAVKQYDKTV